MNQMQEAVVKAAEGFLRLAQKQDAKLSGIYEYKLSKDAVWCWRARADLKNGGKYFCPFFWNGARYVGKEPDAPPEGKPLYRLPEILTADATKPVWIVEGEKCADALAELGLTATTSGGSSSAHVTDWQPVLPHPCVLWEDNDEAGKKYMDEVAAILISQGCSVERIDVASLGLPPKGDCADWLAANPAADMQAVLSLKRLETEAPESDEDLLPIKGPEVTDAMYYGFVGEVMREATKETEVHPAAAGIALIAAVSAAFGRNRFFPIGNELHHSRIYSVHVGRSSRGGKGIALGATKRICAKAQLLCDSTNPLFPLVCGNYHDGGLSSREGLSWLIRDASDETNKDGVPIDSGVDDKRLFVVEEELANVLKQSARDGNTLSAALRSAWDGAAIAPATKTNRTRVAAPHIAMHACITPFELHMSLDQNSLTNGFANRFLFVWGERLGLHPYPRRIPDEVVEKLARQLLRAIKHAQLDGEVTASAQARMMYANFYRERRRGSGLTEKLRGLLERHLPYAWRLSLTFALLDCRSEINENDMKAALAWLEYCRESTRFIFSDDRQEVQAEKTAALSNRIVGQLRDAHEQTMNRESLHKALGKPGKEFLNAALQELMDANNLDEISTPRDGGGRPLRKYRLKGIAPSPPGKKCAP
jgi:hypothetical protein